MIWKDQQSLAKLTSIKSVLGIAEYQWLCFLSEVFIADRSQRQSQKIIYRNIYKKK